MKFVTKFKFCDRTIIVCTSVVVSQTPAPTSSVSSYSSNLQTKPGGDGE